MKIKYFLYVLTVAFLFSCAEEKRFKLSEGSTTPPDTPEFIDYRPLPGGAMIFYNIPYNEDVLTIDAEFVAQNGQTVRFSASYFVDSLAVYGFAEEKEYTFQLYATNRAGIKSKPINVTVIPLESALPKVLENIKVKPAVCSFLLDWENELMQMLNVFVNFSYTEGGTTRNLTRVFSSKKAIERQFILDLDIDDNVPIHVQVWIEDTYGNKSEVIDKGEVFVIRDESLDHTKPEWSFPLPGFNMKTGDFVPEYHPTSGALLNLPDFPFMVNGSNVEGRIYFLNDNIIDHANITNFIHTDCNGSNNPYRGRPWNVFIDLGDYYELTRITTWQRRFDGPPEPGDSGNENLGALYRNGENVGYYAMYRWDEETDDWEFLNDYRIPNLRNMGLGTLEIVMKHYREGDQTYILPDPGFTKPTRWFRYEAIAGFGTNTDFQCLSEISFHGRKYQP